MATLIRVLIAFSFFIYVANSYGYSGNYCEFNGILTDPSRTHEDEFKMLLEPKDNPNSITMTNAVAGIAIAPLEDLKNSECKISRYVKELLLFYESNKQKMDSVNPEVSRMLKFIDSTLKSAKD